MSSCWMQATHSCSGAPLMTSASSTGISQPIRASCFGLDEEASLLADDHCPASVLVADGHAGLISLYMFLHTFSFAYPHHAETSHTSPSIYIYIIYIYVPAVREYDTIIIQDPTWILKLVTHQIHSKCQWRSVIKQTTHPVHFLGWPIRKKQTILSRDKVYPTVQPFLKRIIADSADWTHKVRAAQICLRIFIFSLTCFRTKPLEFLMLRRCLLVWAPSHTFAASIAATPQSHSWALVSHHPTSWHLPS